MNNFTVTSVYENRAKHKPQGDLSGQYPKIGDIVTIAPFAWNNEKKVWCIEVNDSYGAWFDRRMIDEHSG